MYAEPSISNTTPVIPQLEVEVCLDVAHDKVCEEVRQEHLVEECEGLHPEQLHRYHEGETRAAVASNLGTGGQNLHPRSWDNLGWAEVEKLKQEIRQYL